MAAANWPVTLIQASADSLFKLLLAAPVIGGIFLVALVRRQRAVGADLARVARDGRHDRRVAAVAPGGADAVFLAVAVVGVGGSLFVFLVKAGTVATLVQSEREAAADRGAAAAAERGRARVALLRGRLHRVRPRPVSALRAARVHADGRLPRVGLAFLVLVASRDPGEGWSLTALLTLAFVLWITVVNLLYLLVQIVVAADDCSVATAGRRVAAFLRRERGDVGRVFLLVLALISARPAPRSWRPLRSAWLRSCRSWAWRPCRCSCWPGCCAAWSSSTSASRRSAHT